MVEHLAVTLSNHMQELETFLASLFESLRKSLIYRVVVGWRKRNSQEEYGCWSQNLHDYTGCMELFDDSVRAVDMAANVQSSFA